MDSALDFIVRCVEGQSHAPERLWNGGNMSLRRIYHVPYSSTLYLEQDPHTTAEVEEEPLPFSWRPYYLRVSTTVDRS